MSVTTTVTEWRVETDQTEDDFGTNEQHAREWLAYCESKPEWMPAVLMSRTVTTTTSAWTAAHPARPEGGEEVGRR